MAKKEVTKARIVKVATDRFCRDGFVKASIRDIVKDAKITNSTIYLHFKSKDEILYGIIRDIGDKLIEIHEKAIEEHKDPVDCLKAMIEGQVRLAREKPKEVKIFVEEQYQLSRNLRRKARAHQRRLYDVFLEKVSDAEKEGFLNNVNKAVATFSIIGVMSWVNRWYKEDGELSIQEIATELVKLLFGGLVRTDRLEAEKSKIGRYHG